MSSKTLLGHIDWNFSEDREGYRDYNVAWLARTDDLLDGPLSMLFTPGLPVVGSYWQLGNDTDFWAFCTPEIKLSPVLTKEPGYWWIIEQVFSNRPFRRCQDSSIDNPLFEPYRIGGDFSPFTEQAWFGADGKPFLNSSGELFKGKETEFDSTKCSVKIGMNITDMPLNLIAPAQQMVNDSFLWGCPPRCVKLSATSWSRQLYGTCSFYYTVDFTFDIDFNTFDKYVYDTGTMILRPDTDPDNPVDPDDPSEYVVYCDKRGNKPKRVFLDGSGKPLTNRNSPVQKILQKYVAGNLLLLGVPSTLA